MSKTTKKPWVVAKKDLKVWTKVPCTEGGKTCKRLHFIVPESSPETFPGRFHLYCPVIEDIFMASPYELVRASPKAQGFLAGFLAGSKPKTPATKLGDYFQPDDIFMRWHRENVIKPYFRSGGRAPSAWACSEVDLNRILQIGLKLDLFSPKVIASWAQRMGGSTTSRENDTLIKVPKFGPDFTEQWFDMLAQSEDMTASQLLVCIENYNTEASMDVTFPLLLLIPLERKWSRSDLHWTLAKMQLLFEINEEYRGNRPDDEEAIMKYISISKKKIGNPKITVKSLVSDLNDTLLRACRHELAVKELFYPISWQIP